MRRSLIASLVAPAFALCALSSGRALAQPSSDAKARAEALFEEAQALMRKGDFGTACPKFAASEKLDPAVGTLLNLATCYERQGKTASAWASFREAASVAGRAGQVERQKYADKHADVLTKKLSKVVIRVSGAGAGLEVKLDGTVVDSSEWGEALPLDPGSHLVEVSAPGKRKWSTNVDVGGEATQSEIAVPTLADEPVATPPPPPPSLPANEPPPAPSTASPLKPVGIAFGVVGLIGVGIGMGFGLNAMNKNDEALTHCPNSPQCNDLQGVSLTDEARSSATAATAAVVIGGVMLAAGITLFVIAPSTKHPSATASIAPLLGPGLGGASFGGTF